MNIIRVRGNFQTKTVHVDGVILDTENRYDWGVDNINTNWFANDLIVYATGDNMLAVKDYTKLTKTLLAKLPRTDIDILIYVNNNPSTWTWEPYK